MELLIGMYVELIATLMLALAAMTSFKKTIDVAHCDNSQRSEQI
jgi:hypothetical protein